MPREIPKPWDAFLKDLDRTLEEPVELHCLGGFVLTMLYGLKRPTADVDVLAVRPRMDLNPLAGISSSLHKKHRVYLQLVTVLEAYPEDYEERLTEISPVRSETFGSLRSIRTTSPSPSSGATASGTETTSFTSRRPLRST
jgi:hypothetical protein